MPPIANLESTALSSTPLSLPLTPVFPSQPPLETHHELSIAADQSHPGREVKNRVFNYYFLFLALLTAALAALLWWIHRQRRREREQIRSEGQHALARDVERWAIYRRNQPPTVEGLNESGEAPPPYKPKDDTVATLEPINDNPELADDVAIPPRVRTRDGIEHARLPEYVKSIRLDHSDSSLESARPAVQTLSARPGGNAT
ncbi:hypothetical protein BU25DRAFT_457451 [Macroventuria anomochaeta]|uniref:Uncharacterized protein n=1 Tax=Macroventuria anomochaeta TaxID=301207 RepID=A0ACB6S4U0_9PLEO|nr:uncharacterized protein BU25DRAFT_457451 [Macroventuria anomochaeta]KAF2628645.1 hypothetical protein BU25DRAFT_457451 [Macroventuria anomochaeta]